MKILINNFTRFNINQSQIAKIIRHDLASHPHHNIIELSVAFITSRRARILNQLLRHKDYIPAILTFPAPIFEILICPTVATKLKLSLPELIQHGIKHLLKNHYK